MKHRPPRALGQTVHRGALTPRGSRIPVGWHFRARPVVIGSDGAATQHQSRAGRRKSAWREPQKLFRDRLFHRYLLSPFFLSSLFFLSFFWLPESPLPPVGPLAAAPPGAAEAAGCGA